MARIKAFCANLSYACTRKTVGPIFMGDASTQPGCSPPRQQPTSHSNKVADLILSSCRLSDPSCHISSVLRDSEGRTVVRVRADPRNNPLVLLRALQKLWPLAKSCVQENALDGTVEAEVVVPRQKDEQRRALLRAKRNRFSEFLLVLSGVMFFIALVVYANDCYVSLSNTTARAATAREL